MAKKPRISINKYLGGLGWDGFSSMLEKIFCIARKKIVRYDTNFVSC
jgi:hypothetical protein